MIRATALVLGLVLAAPAAPAAAEDVADVTAGSGQPLAGHVVVVDAGHQLGNHRYPRKISRLVPAGGFRKPCNAVGARTRRGTWEATIVWRVSRVLVRRLEAQGAQVVLTRDSNRRDRWGPCVDVRGRRGNRVDADLKLSLHGDGAASSGRGFHVIHPTDRRRWTHDIFVPSRRLARIVKASLEGRHLRVADYTAGGDGLDARGDLATLNLSDVPTVMVELGNLRNRRDAALLTSSSGHTRYARGLLDAVRAFLRVG